MGRGLSCLPLLALLASGSVHAATLRTNIRVDHPRVRLSDLFSGLTAGQDADIGDAPALGGNYVVGGPQLTAIAAQFGVDWPDASPLVSTTVTRATRMIEEDDVLPVLRQSFDFPEDAHVEMTLVGFKPVAVPAQETAAPTVLHLDWSSHEGGHFSARMEIPSSTGGKGTAFPVTGTVTMEVKAVALRHSVRPGQPILPEDVSVTLVRSSDVPDDALQSIDDAVGLETRSSLSAGQVLASSQLVHPQLVRRGSPVVLSYSQSSLHLTVSGTVMEAGGKGDMVHVYNASSRMVLTGRVIGRTEVEVIPGITPLSADSRNRPEAVSLPTL
ncbi:flagellar biosynthesis protein FlgA [Gluconobacter japonicus]|uniref:Flagellar basal body P-ring formation protein FlgA n=1 Tax=Gluconobacter japonicus TaxID=376620 RepID=A0A9Q2FLP5_GLUJA|nr:flagellar basal body P-ring formation chaperone FlgA [Gluconobacter japonicus]KXV40158.1 flagellar biosynthesis protein FlgA [Gluconobacter japonicus]MBF0870097.1 flagellar basal body P-ring formation protein FlgA [Gluconobacter japonicus]